MSVILRHDRDVHAPAGVFGLLRFTELPDTRSVAPRISALVRAYSRLVGKELPLVEAIRVLDRIVADRDDMPFPAEYSRVADHLLGAEYDLEDVHAIVGHLARGGSVANCSAIAPGDRAAILDLMPRRPSSPNFKGVPSGAGWQSDPAESACGR